MEREDSIASRVMQRKRRWGIFRGKESTCSSCRRRVEVCSSQSYNDGDIDVIKKAFGHYQHHGTGNPLAMRAPSSSKDYAVNTLAKIIESGVVGQTSSDSTPKLKTERGRKGSFWTCRLRLAGSYGWTGLVLPSDAKTDNPFPIENVKWFVVDSQDDSRHNTVHVLQWAGGMILVAAQPYSGKDTVPVGGDWIYFAKQEHGSNAHRPDSGS